MEYMSTIGIILIAFKLIIMTGYILNTININIQKYKKITNINHFRSIFYNDVIFHCYSWFCIAVIIYSIISIYYKTIKLYKLYDNLDIIHQQIKNITLQ